MLRIWKDADNDSICDASEEQKIFAWSITGELKQADVYRIEDVTLQHYRVEYTCDNAGTGMLSTRAIFQMDGNVGTEQKRSRYYWEGYDLYLEEEGDGSTYHDWQAKYAYVNQPSILSAVLARVDLGSNHQLDSDASNNLTDSAYFYEYDEAGNVVLITDASGEIVTDATGETIHFEEDSWGNDLNNTFDKSNIEQHRTNKMLDDITGLYYCSARWYDPEIGRFISVSPLSPMGEEEYVYCSSDPINYTDVDGALWHPIDTLREFTSEVVNKFLSILIRPIDPTRRGNNQPGINPTFFPEDDSFNTINKVGIDVGNRVGEGAKYSACGVAGGLAGKFIGNIKKGGRFTENIKRAGEKAKLNKIQLNDAIHDIKQGYEDNWDVIFDLETGDVIHRISGEVMGNLKNYKK